MHLHKRNCSARRCSETPCRTSHNQTRQAGGLLCIPIVLGSVTSAAATGEAAYLVGYITTSYCFHNKTQPPPLPPRMGRPTLPPFPSSPPPYPRCPFHIGRVLLKPWTYVCTGPWPRRCRFGCPWTFHVFRHWRKCYGWFESRILVFPFVREWFTTFYNPWIQMLRLLANRQAMNSQAQSGKQASKQTNKQTKQIRERKIRASRCRCLAVDCRSKYKTCLQELAWHLALPTV